MVRSRFFGQEANVNAKGQCMSSKSIIRSIVVLFILGASMPSWALWTHTSGGAEWGFTYTGENNKSAEVNRVVETYSSSLSVPAIVQHDNSTNTNKWPVVRVNLNPTITNIRDVVTSISIPHSVTNVAASCFDRYINLRSAIWQTDQTASIGNYAFASCSNLVSVTLSADKLGMGIGVFKNCVSLPTVSLPKTLNSIAKPNPKGRRGSQLEKAKSQMPSKEAYVVKCRAKVAEMENQLSKARACLAAEEAKISSLEPVVQNGIATAKHQFDSATSGLREKWRVRHGEAIEEAKSRLKRSIDRIFAEVAAMNVAIGNVPSKTSK